MGLGVVRLIFAVVRLIVVIRLARRWACLSCWKIFLLVVLGLVVRCRLPTHEVCLDYRWCVGPEWRREFVAGHTAVGAVSVGHLLCLLQDDGNSCAARSAQRHDLLALAFVASAVALLMSLAARVK